MKSTHGGGCVGCWLLAAAATTGGRMATSGEGLGFVRKDFPVKNLLSGKFLLFLPLQGTSTNKLNI